MSEKSVRKRKWYKVAYFTVPVLAFALWVYSALQFQEIPFSFIPKNPTDIERKYYEISSKSLVEPIEESTGLTWTVPGRVTLNDYLKEITMQGFKQYRSQSHFDTFRRARNENIAIMFDQDPVRNETEVNVEYSRLESRAPYALVKHLKLKYDRMKRRNRS